VRSSSSSSSGEYLVELLRLTFEPEYARSESYSSRILNHIVTSVPVCEAQRAPSQPALQANQEEAQEDALQAKELPKRHTQREPEARAAAVATAALAQTASPPLDALLLRLHRQNQRWLRKAS
jgi:hypothetical protein